MNGTQAETAPFQIETQSDEEALAEGQRRLLERRREIAEQQLAEIDAARSKRRLATCEAPEMLATPPEIPVKRVSAPPKRPHERITELGARILAEGHPTLLYVVPRASDFASEAETRARIRAIIPEKFHDVTWGTLGSLVPEDEDPRRVRSLRGVKTGNGLNLSEGRWLRGQDAVDELQRRMRAARKVVLFGDSRAGKTIAAVAALEDELHTNMRAQYLHVMDLNHPEAVARALQASYLVLDDVGYETNGAAPGNGWLAHYTKATREFMARWYQLRGRRLVVTTNYDYDGILERYEAPATTRIFESADCIRVGIAPTL